MGRKTDTEYMAEALVEIDIVIKYSKDLSYEAFISDQKTIDAIALRLQQMIEKIKYISQEFKDNHREIPWGEIMGFRNGLVHEYGSTDYTTMYEVATRDIYQLKELFESSL